MSTTAFSSGIVTFVSALFCFIAYGTLGWTYQWAQIDGVCDSDYKVFIGLYKARTELEVDCSGGGSYSDSTTENADCDGLSGDQCDLLEGAQGSASTAVAAAVILLIVQILFLIIGRGDSSFISKMLSFASAITSITFAITAFTACGNWNDLTKDINDDLPSDWEFELGYSWYLMLFSGLFAIGVVVLSVIIFCQDVKGKSDNSLLNNA